MCSLGAGHDHASLQVLKTQATDAVNWCRGSVTCILCATGKPDFEVASGLTVSASADPTIKVPQLGAAMCNASADTDYRLCVEWCRGSVIRCPCIPKDCSTTRCHNTACLSGSKEVMPACTCNDPADTSYSLSAGWCRGSVTCILCATGKPDFEVASGLTVSASADATVKLPQLSAAMCNAFADTNYRLC